MAAAPALPPEPVTPAQWQQWFADVARAELAALGLQPELLRVSARELSSADMQEAGFAGMHALTGWWAWALCREGQGGDTPRFWLVCHQGTPWRPGKLSDGRLRRPGWQALAFTTLQEPKGKLFVKAPAPLLPVEALPAATPAPSATDREPAR